MNERFKPMAPDLTPSIPAGTYDTDDGSAKESFTSAPPLNKGDETDNLRFLSPPQAADELGRLGGYRILRILGQGGMGLVLEAEDVGLNRRIALKVMRPELAHRTANRQRFMREAKAAAAVEHLNIMAIHQVGEENGVPFIAMPFLKGKSLDARMKDSRLSVPEQLSIGLQTAAGLAAAHARGLIHRDIKPANIWLEDVAHELNDTSHTIRVKILDFGLARFMDDQMKLTSWGALLGTPAYMPPEQAAGATVDERADLFSFGAVLYEMATGRLPFQGNTFAAIVISLTNDTPIEPIQLNPQLPLAASRLIMHLLEKNPAQRPPSAKVVAESLRQIRQEKTTVLTAVPAAPPITTIDPGHDTDVMPGGEPVRPAGRGRFRARLTAAAVLALLLGSFAVYQLAFTGESESEPEHGQEIARNLQPESPNKASDVDSARPDLLKNAVGNIELPITGADPKREDLGKASQIAVTPPKENTLLNPALQISPTKVVPNANDVEQHKPGEVVEVEIAEGVMMKFCWVPGGKATLGSPETEPERIAEREKEHEFTTKGFWLAKYAATQEEWEAVMGKNPSYFAKEGGGKDKVADMDTSRFPVETVSWSDCEQFLEKLNRSVKLPRAMGKGKLALPHEDQWEYACRGGKGNQQAFYFGDALNGRQANCDGNFPHGTERKGPCLGHTARVGSYEDKAPHPWGLCDMSGNVYQWCSNWYNTQQTGRICRGGSWYDGPRYCRSALRNDNSPDIRVDYIGCRLIVSPD